MYGKGAKKFGPVDAAARCGSEWVRSCMKTHLILLVVSSLITALLSWLGGWGVGWAAAMAFLGWPILGTLVTADDDLPGGWNNPDGSRKPDWELPEFWCNVTGRGAIVCAAFLLQVGVASTAAAVLVSAGASLALLSAYLFRRSRAGQQAS